MGNYHLENRYQDSGWEPLTGCTFDDFEKAEETATEFSKDSISYGMVRIVHSDTRKVLMVFPAGGPSPCGRIGIEYPIDEYSPFDIEKWLENR